MHVVAGAGQVPSPCSRGGHSLELLKAKMLFLEGKYFQDNTVAFNLISRLKKESLSKESRK